MSSDLSVQHTFEQIQLSDSYTRNIVFGYIRDISSDFLFTIPSIIYELCVSFYYAGEHFAYLGYDMDIRSETYQTYNNICEMTSDDKWNTCYGQVQIDTKLKINYVYEWLLEINTTYATSIGFGLSTEYDKTDDAFWICTKSNPKAKYYSFTASINAFEKLSLLSSNFSHLITYDRSLLNNDKIKLIFNVKKKMIKLFISNNDPIIVHNIETNKLKYHLSISMCGKYVVRLLHFKRNKKKKHIKEYNCKKHKKHCNYYYGNIEIGILSKSQNYYNDSDDILTLKEGEILTLSKIISDYQSIKPNQMSRKQLIIEFANKKIQINEIQALEEIYSLIELIILFVIRNKYKDNVIFTQNYFNDVSQFVEWIFYDENNMDSSKWPIHKFATKFDDWIQKIIQ